MQNYPTKIVQYFTAWAKLKITIHFEQTLHPVYFKERQIWWVSLGQNIGSEQNGKHKNFERPVLILKKFNAEMFLAIPISSQVKIGDYRYVFERYGMKYTTNLSQMRVMSAKRLLRQLGKLAGDDFVNIQQIFRKMA